MNGAGLKCTNHTSAERRRAFKAIPIHQGTEEGQGGNEEEGKHKEHSRD